jgi:hypothetical protein
VDPARASALHRADADPNLRFIFEKQLQEADLTCFTKSDIYPEAPKIAQGPAKQISAKIGLRLLRLIGGGAW